MRPPDKELPEWTDAELLAWLREQYKAEPIPPCRVCGGPLTIASIGGGNATRWACDMWERDPSKPEELRRKEGRGCADEHYSRSQWTQYRDGDSAVLELCARLERHNVTQGAPAPSPTIDRAEVLHCYAQAFWHTEAYLSGGRGALMALRSTIDKALHDGSGECDLFTSDGEGYTVHVVAMTDADAERQVVPYTDDCARQPWNDAFGPWDALRANVGAKAPT